MLLFVDFNRIEYQQSFIAFLVPIFHVMFYGIWSPDAEDLAAPAAVEALAASALVRFLSAPPFTFGTLVTGAEQEKDLANLFLAKLAPYQLFQTRRTFAALPFLAKWIQNLFAMDLPLENVILIWNWLLKEVEKRRFMDAIVAVCAAIPVELRAECQRADSDELMELVRDLTRLPVLAVLARAAKM
jgi:hypothetical protein